MGDQGHLYVNEDVVPAYKALISNADLILPNQFEAELLSGIQIMSLANIADAITAIHRIYNVPHIIVTSVQFPDTMSSSSSSTLSLAAPDSSTATQDYPPNTLMVIGSTMRSDGSARLFKVDVPRLDCYFCGTGDMFAALMVGRLREAVFAAEPTTPPLHETPSWVSPDHISATHLPLAKATERILASMNAILERTMAARTEELDKYRKENEGDPSVAHLSEAERKAAAEKRAHLRQTKAAEVRLVRNVNLLVNPEIRYFAEEWCM
ncbi:Putative pyridoxal kinase [Emydomyces testavorans]|uniref:pyridoxal kinase n=1 Tax=Emydomyces testavorans TaxID=2070801 RepID=A0AAF0DJV0_9EURO|nr:Putative pyridoxal kinase [Emydomyces testavorans]